MRNIVKYILKRILGIIPILIVISFSLMNLSSGDPAEIALTSQGTVVTPELLEEVHINMG